MLHLVQVYDSKEGFVEVGIESKGNVMHLYGEDKVWPRKSVSMEDNEYIDDTGVVYDLFALFKYLCKRDLAVIPKQPFVFVNMENHSGIVRYDAGLGYLYPNGNSYIYISKRKADTPIKSLPAKLTGVTVENYKPVYASYIVRDNETDQVHIIPYHVVDTLNYNENPLLHFNPLTITFNVDDSEFEWEDVEGATVKIHKEVKNIGSTYKVYIKDTNGNIYQTRVNYAALNNMSIYKVKVKLSKGLTRLSTSGAYLKDVEAIIKHIGGLT